MAKKLSLRLNYKGKFLDYAKEGFDFKKSFFIGSNKYLQWQILDPSFPDKHLFITKKGSDYFMQLLPNAQLSCTKDGSPVDTNYLKQNGILNGNQLLLKPDMTGNLNISADWQINYEFREPWVTVLTAEEKQIVAQYSRRPEVEASERFNRNTLVVIGFLTALFIMIFQLTYKPSVTLEATLENKLAAMQSQQEAQKVEAQANASIFEDEEVAAPAPEAKAAEGPTGKEGATEAAPAGPKGLSFGDFDASKTATGLPANFKIAAVTTVEGFNVGRRTGGGSGPGGGPGGGPGSGPGGSAGSFNTDAVNVFGTTGSVATVGPKGTGMAIQQGQSGFEHRGGDASKLAAPGIAFGNLAKLKKLEEEFRRKNIATLKETQISALSEQQRQNYSSLKDQVKAKENQFAQAFREFGSGFNASFDITILVDANGRVSAAKVVPKGSEIPEAFVAKVQEIVERWTFNVKESMGYEFPVRLRKK